MLEYKKFDPSAFVRAERGKPPKASKVPKVAPSLGALGGLDALAKPIPRDGETVQPANSQAVWGESENERAAIIEFDGRSPRAWAEALARLDASRPPVAIPSARWLRFVNDCGRFVDDGWAAPAEALGWAPLDLFGFDRQQPAFKLDRSGLLWQLNGARLILLSAETAISRSDGGKRQTYVRLSSRSGRVLAWRVE